jgi:putative addiction module component (TIGR02574 family)
MMTVDFIEEQACSLGRSDKSRIIDTLLKSLDADDEIEKAWDAEIHRRANEIESGTVECIPLNDAMLQLRQYVMRSQNAN